MTDYNNLTDHQLYDELLNAYYGQSDVQQLLTSFSVAGVTEKRIKMAVNKANKKGGTNIQLNETPMQVIKIEPDEKLLKLELDADRLMQNVCDKFLLQIYGNKFNSGVNGAFGEAQSILSNAKGKHFILLVPNNDKLGGFSNSNSTRFSNSVNHYRKSGNGDVTFKYF